MPNDDDDIGFDPDPLSVADDTPGFEHRSDTSKAAARHTNTSRGALEVIKVLRAFSPEPLCAFEIEGIIRANDPGARAEDPRKSNIGSRLAEMYDAYCLDMPGVARDTLNKTPAQAYILWEGLTDEQLLTRYGEARRAWNAAARLFRVKFDRPRPRLDLSFRDERLNNDRPTNEIPHEILDRIRVCVAQRETNPILFTRPRTHVTQAENDILRAARHVSEAETPEAIAELLEAIRAAYRPV